MIIIDNLKEDYKFDKTLNWDNPELEEFCWVFLRTDRIQNLLDTYVHFKTTPYSEINQMKFYALEYYLKYILNGAGHEPWVIKLFFNKKKIETPT